MIGNLGIDQIILALAAAWFVRNAVRGSVASHGTSPNVEQGLTERFRGTILGLIMIVVILYAMMIAICYALMRAKM